MQIRASGREISGRVNGYLGGQIFTGSLLTDPLHAPRRFIFHSNAQFC